MRSTIAFTLAAAVLIAATLAADASRCPPGYHWDEWAKVCRPIR